MTELLEDQYLEWIFDQVGLQSGKPRVTHWQLLRRMYEKPFVGFIPNDDNRAIDGKALRDEFLHTGRPKPVDNAWLAAPCSVLEMLVGLSRRLSFEAEGEPSEWFWHLVRNLQIHRLNDPLNQEDVDLIDESLDCLVWRRYHYDGHGGLFPLREPHEDQRTVEIWYQMSSYLMELT